MCGIQQRYNINKEAKVGDRIICPSCYCVGRMYELDGGIESKYRRWILGMER